MTEGNAMPLSPADMATIIKDEIYQWEATSYRLGLRVRVQQKLGNAQGIQAAEKNMEDAEAALDVLREELKTLALEPVAPS